MRDDVAATWSRTSGGTKLLRMHTLGWDGSGLFLYGWCRYDDNAEGGAKPRSADGWKSLLFAPFIRPFVRSVPSVLVRKLK